MQANVKWFTNHVSSGTVCGSKDKVGGFVYIVA